MTQNEFFLRGNMRKALKVNEGFLSRRVTGLGCEMKKDVGESKSGTYAAGWA